jgi:two-component system, response regulator PdtaR
MSEWSDSVFEDVARRDALRRGAQRSPLVVVADDEAPFRMQVAEALADVGFDVAEAGDAGEVMALLAANPAVRVVVTDIRMQASDGLALSHRIYRRWPSIGIVLISGVFEPSEGARPQGSRFLVKPCRIARIVESVRDLMGRDGGHRDPFARGQPA